MSFPAYDEYKETGDSVLGNVPEHWLVTKLGFLCRKVGSGKTPKGGSETYVDDGVLFIRSQNVYDEGLRLEDVVYISEEVDEEMSISRVEHGDVLLNITGASLGRTCLIADDISSANVNQHVCIIRLKDASQREFVAMAMKAFLIKSQIDACQNGAAREGLNFEQVGQLRLAIPPLPEQKAISSFLDVETSKIDSLVSEQRRLTRLLKEKRQAVISHAVTKGLCPNAPMKPSGIQWLGDVPRHWEVEMLSRVTTKIGNGFVGPTRDILVKSGVPYVQATHIKKGRVNFDGAYFVTPEWAEWQSKAALQLDDVLIVQTSAGTGDIGLVSEEEVGYRCHALIIVRSIKSRLLGSFLSVALQSQYGVQTLESIQTGGMHPHLNCGNVKFVHVPIPPLGEQQVIVEYIMEQSQKFDSLQAEATRAIELLQERRTALISAAVTGKIDVRELAFQESP